MRKPLTTTLATVLTAAGLACVFTARAQQAPPQPAPPPAAAVPPAATAPAAPPAPAFKPSTPTEQALAARLGDFTRAYEAGDVPSLTSLYLDDAIIVDIDGNETQGKEAITRMYTDGFAESGPLKLESQVDSVRLITPDVARLSGHSRISTPTGDAADYTRFSCLAVQKEGRWSIAEIREYPSPAADVSPYERLKDLEWMVGEWVNEGDGNRVTAQVRWADNQSYLIRTYTTEIEGGKSTSGTMFIGWDPQSGQVKSWLFDSEGGRGEGTWTRTDANQWVVKAHGVLRDGLPTSATHIHNLLTKDSVKTDAIDRIVGGQVDGDILDVVMVRKAPTAAIPATAPAAAAPAAN